MNLASSATSSATTQKSAVNLQPSNGTGIVSAVPPQHQNATSTRNSGKASVTNAASSNGANEKQDFAVKSNGPNVSTKADLTDTAEILKSGADRGRPVGNDVVDAIVVVGGDGLFSGMGSNEIMSSNATQAKKKSSFQITKVITKESESRELDVTDELDEPNTEDLSSDVFDVSRVADGPLSADTIHSPMGAEDVWSVPLGASAAGTNQMTAGSRNATVGATSTPIKETAVSRFKIVKIESKDHRKRGRWLCSDFADPVGSVSATGPSPTGSVGANGVPSLNVTTVTPPDPHVYYVTSGDVALHAKSPFTPAIIYNEGHPMLERNPIEISRTFFPGGDWEMTSQSWADVSVPTTLTMNMAAASSEAPILPPLVMPSSSADGFLTADQLRMLSPRASEGSDLKMQFVDLLNKRGAGGRPGSPVYTPAVATMNPLAIFNGVDDGDNSANSSVAIDNKIEQAMDLVKNHLMFAVREEVEVLKEQIKELLEKNHQLEIENKILRADATPETLAKLQTMVESL